MGFEKSMTAQEQDAASYWETVKKQPLKNRVEWLEAENRQLKEQLSNSERAAALHIQEYFELSNKFADLDNQIKGVIRYGPKSHTNAVAMFDFVLSQVTTIFEAKPIFHQGTKWPPFWQLFAGAIAVIVTLAFVWPGSTLADGFGRAMLLPANQIVFVLAIVAVILITVLMLWSSKKSKPH